jgi:hypothetical protein
MRLERMETSTDALVMEKTTESAEKRAIFEKLAQIEADDHEELKHVKKQLKSLIKHEMHELGFQKQLSEEEAAAITNQVADTKSGFFFKFNQNKAQQNKRVFDFKAPGNHHRHPSVIVPHEGVHPQNQIDVATLTKEKLVEIYAFYHYLIDLHIS